MVKQDLINYSPVRLFDEITGGGLKSGELGLVTAKKGLGKTSVLVQFGLDSLLHDRQVVHVSFDQHSDNVISWYDGILSEIGKKKNIGNIDELYESIMRSRTILNFNQENFTLPKVVNTIKALKEGGINVASIVVDGIDLSKVSADEVKAVSDFAKTEKITVWFSSTNESDKLSDTLSKDLEPLFDMVGHLASSGNGVVLSLLKSAGKTDLSVGVKLDSKTLLMSR